MTYNIVLVSSVAMMCFLIFLGKSFYRAQCNLPLCHLSSECRSERGDTGGCHSAFYLGREGFSVIASAAEQWVWTASGYRSQWAASSQEGGQSSDYGGLCSSEHRPKKLLG